MSEIRSSSGHHGAADLAVVLAEAAAGRARRVAARCAELVEGARTAPDAVGALEDAAVTLRALRHLEELTERLPADAGRLGPHLERMLTAHLIASSTLTYLSSRLEALPLPDLSARCVLAAVREMLHVVDSVADPDNGMEAAFLGRAEDGLVVLVVRTCADALPAPSASGAEALARLARLAGACSGAVRRRLDGGHLKIAVVLGMAA